MDQMNEKRSALFTWNEETDRQFGLDRNLGDPVNEEENELDTREEQIAPKESPSGVV
jgi:hypothetical protein